MVRSGMASAFVYDLGWLASAVDTGVPYSYPK